jgi:archaellum biogenesis ATPase FlaH
MISYETQKRLVKAIDCPLGSLPDELFDIGFDATIGHLTESFDVDLDKLAVRLDLAAAVVGAKRDLGHQAILQLRQEVIAGLHAAKGWIAVNDPWVSDMLNLQAEPDTEWDYFEDYDYTNLDAGQTAPTAYGKFSIRRINCSETTLRTTWLVDGIIPEKGIVLLYGSSGVGKSFAVLDLAFAVHYGTNWAGHLTHCGDVVYVAAEDAAGIASRIAKIMNDHKLEDDGILLVDSCFDLSRNSSDHFDLIESLPFHARKTVRLVIVDTLQMALGDADENSASDATAIMRNCRRISDALNCAVVLVHHAGKDTAKKARGSSAYTGAADTVIYMSGTKSQKTLVLQKQKNGPGGLTCTGKLLPIDDGEGCYLQLEDWSNGVSEPRKAGKAPLSEIVLGLVTGHCDSNKCRSVSRNKITDMIVELPEQKGKDRGAVRKNVQRAIIQLVEDKHLSADLTTVYLPEKKSPN